MKNQHIRILCVTVMVVSWVSCDAVSKDVHLNSLAGPAGFSVTGVGAGDRTAYSVSGVGDVNKDGVDDFVMGARLASPLVNGQTRNSAGVAYVIFGRGDSNTNIDLLPLLSAGSPLGFTIFGAADSFQFGSSVSAAGDVNGDGVKDIIIGAYWADPSVSGVVRSDAGMAYVIFGRSVAVGPDSYSNIDLANFNVGGVLGFAIIGAEASDCTGFSAAAGDVNKDGVDDVIVGALYANAVVSTVSRADSGISYVIFGRKYTTGVNSYTNVDLLPISTTGSILGFAILGAKTGDTSGFSVSGVGDVNGDTIDDVLVGAFQADPAVGGVTRTGAGAAYVIFGRSSTLSSGVSYANIDLATFAATSTSFGFAILGGTAGGAVGRSVSGAGDVNGDGLRDIIIGAYNADAVVNGVTRAAAGVSVVLFGRTGPLTNIDLASVATGGGFFDFGASAGDYSGWSVFGAGDVNGDGLSDVIIGALNTDTILGGVTQSDSGCTCVVFGRSAVRGVASYTNVDTATFTAGTPLGYLIIGAAANDHSGYSVSAAGDVNADGIADLIIGSPDADRSAVLDAGVAYIIFGGIAQPTSQPSSQPSRQPTTKPSRQPSGQPTIQPLAIPSTQPTKQPSGWPSSQPSSQPSNAPTRQPISSPSVQPTAQPSCRPSAQPTGRPTARPSTQSSSQPSVQPSGSPSVQPSAVPTVPPTSRPSAQPSVHPTQHPSNRPSARPFAQPSAVPSSSPSTNPTAVPTLQPSSQPSLRPTGHPTTQPTSQPTTRPVSDPSGRPTALPSSQPTSSPSAQPTRQPASWPTGTPSSLPSAYPSAQPTSGPSKQPHVRPSAQPSKQPSRTPSAHPSCMPSTQPTAHPSRQPAAQPSTQPVAWPSTQPSTKPSAVPSRQPSGTPSRQPTCTPTTQPTTQPLAQPSSRPSCQPSSQPSTQPSQQPRAVPSGQPTSIPSLQPTLVPTGEWATIISGASQLTKVSYLGKDVWACGEGTGDNSVSCVLSDALTGLAITHYNLDWDAITSVLSSSDASSVLISGVNHDGAVKTSELATCAVLRSQLRCTVTSFLDSEFAAVSYVPYARKYVHTGSYNVHTTVTIIDPATASAQSYMYTASNMKALVLSQVTSPPYFVGGFVAGTTVRATAAPVNYIVAGMVRTEAGIFNAMVLMPQGGDIINSVDLVNAMALEATGPDSFIAGALQVDGDFSKHAYMLRANALFMTVQYCVRYQSFASGGRRALSVDAPVQSVVRGMVLVGSTSTLFMIIDRTLNNITALTVLKTTASNGAITKQAHITAPNATSLYCTGITQTGDLLSVLCSIQSSTGLRTLLIAADQDLSFAVLPHGFTRSDEPKFQVENVPFKRTVLVVTKTSTAIPTSTYELSTANNGPTRFPSAAPSYAPSCQPSSAPSAQPSSSPTAAPSVSARPTSQPSSASPTNTHKPTVQPTPAPTMTPSAVQTVRPSFRPTTNPSVAPTRQPSTVPSPKPTAKPSAAPTTAPVIRPTMRPTLRPSTRPSICSTVIPSAAPAEPVSVSARGSSGLPPYLMGASIGGGVAPVLPKRPGS